MSVSKTQVLQWAGRLVKKATLCGLSQRFGFGSVNPPASDNSQGAEDSQQPVRFIQWFGFRSSPVIKGTDCIVVAPRGGTTNAVCVAADNLLHGRTNLREGESLQYSGAGAEAFMRNDGAVLINSGTPSGQPQADVQVNGGTSSVSRVGDKARATLRAVQTVVSVSPPVFSLTLYAVDGVTLTTIFQITAAGTVAVPPAPGVPNDVELVSELYEGADHFKA